MAALACFDCKLPHPTRPPPPPHKHRLYALALDDCPGCSVLAKLCQFYESKTRKRPKKNDSGA